MPASHVAPTVSLASFPNYLDDIGTGQAKVHAFDGKRGKRA